MSVIDLSTRLTTSQDNFERHKCSDISFIFSPSDDLTSTSGLSIDLHAGSRYQIVSSGITHAISPSGVKIPPRQSLLIDVKETVYLPNNVFGLIFSVGKSVLDQGVYIPTTKIEPGFRDNLSVLLVNSTSAPVIISSGEKIATAIFLTTTETVEVAAFKKRKPATYRANWKERMSRLITAGVDPVNVVSGAIVALITLLLTVGVQSIFGGN